MAYTETKTNEVPTTYDLAVFRIKGVELYVDSFKITRKRKLERVTATCKLTGVAWKVSDEEYSFEASEIIDKDDILNDLWVEDIKDKTGFQIDTYNFLPGGDLVFKDGLTNCMLSEFDTETSKGDKVSIKGEALNMITT